LKEQIAGMIIVAKEIVKKPTISSKRQIGRAIRVITGHKIIGAVDTIPALTGGQNLSIGLQYDFFVFVLQVSDIEDRFASTAEGRVDLSRGVNRKITAS
jgi:hypothetical protein